MQLTNPPRAVNGGAALAERAVPPGEELVFSSRGVDCRGSWLRPAGAEPGPCVVLAHGFDGVREQRLDEYARRFAAAGIAAFAFDYRFFGASGGEPRQRFSNAAQLDDWRAAIDFVRGLDGVDPDRVALWGTSTSGGHVVKLAAEDARIAAVVAQMPFASGFAQFSKMPITQSLRLVWAGLKDQLGAWLGAEPFTIPAAGRPRTLAVTTTPDALSGLDRITPIGSSWRNEVLARFALSTTFYNPGRAARRLRCPLLVCVADGDRVIALEPALKLARRGSLRRYGYGHFEMYHGEGFERAVADQAAFLRERLLADGGRRRG